MKLDIETKKSALGDTVIAKWIHGEKDVDIWVIQPAGILAGVGTLPVAFLTKLIGELQKVLRMVKEGDK